MALGIVLVVIGAIMRYAVTATATGFSIHQAGVIFLLVGIAVFVMSVLIIALGGRSRTTTRTDIQQTPAGQARIEQRSDWSTP
jgi:Domain of unknown function (DUF6458)